MGGCDDIGFPSLVGDGDEVAVVKDGSSCTEDEVDASLDGAMAEIVACIAIEIPLVLWKKVDVSGTEVIRKGTDKEGILGGDNRAI